MEHGDGRREYATMVGLLTRHQAVVPIVHLHDVSPPATADIVRSYRNMTGCRRVEEESTANSERQGVTAVGFEAANQLFRLEIPDVDLTSNPAGIQEVAIESQ